MPTEKPNSTLLALAGKWLAGKITDQEKSEFDQWYNAFDDSRYELLSGETEEMMEKRIKESILRRAGIEAKPAENRKLWLRMRLDKRAGNWAAAAAVLIIVGAGLWFYNLNTKLNDNPAIVNQNDIAPGKNTAMLTLNNGKIIHLSDAKTGVVIDADKLAYNDGTEISTAVRAVDHATTLTASTPRGGQYQITLPDGTKVWLNAATILKFPSTFIGLSDRKVELSGEAYFEVAKDKKHPFIVQTKQEEIKVLGTHFNVNSYEDEQDGAITSLLEGAVKMSNVNGSRILKPGERGVGTIKGVMLLNGNATDDVAWKDGEFVFVNEPIESIMKKVARWYDVEVVYQGDMSKQVFAGTVSRYDKISEVLNMLSATNTIHFKLQGRRIIVMD